MHGSTRLQDDRVGLASRERAGAHRPCGGAVITRIGARRSGWCNGGGQRSTKQLRGTQGCRARTVAGCGLERSPLRTIGKPALSSDRPARSTSRTGEPVRASSSTEIQAAARSRNGAVYSFAAIAGATARHRCVAAAGRGRRDGEQRRKSLCRRSFRGCGEQGSRTSLGADGTASSTLFERRTGQRPAPCRSQQFEPDIGRDRGTTSLYVGHRERDRRHLQTQSDHGRAEPGGAREFEKCLKSARRNNCDCNPAVRRPSAISAADTRRQTDPVASPDCCAYGSSRYDRNASTSRAHPPRRADRVHRRAASATRPDASRNLQLAAQITMSPDGQRIYVANKPVC